MFVQYLLSYFALDTLAGSLLCALLNSLAMRDFPDSTAYMLDKSISASHWECARYALIYHFHSKGTPR
jgi:hypothetical protein